MFDFKARTSSRIYGVSSEVIAIIELFESPLSKDVKRTLVKSSINCGIRSGRKNQKPIVSISTFLKIIGINGIEKIVTE